MPRCPNCNHANDSDFRFCQRCGYKRKTLTNKTGTPLAVDLNAIDDRLRQLAVFDQATSYSKQKDSLQKELENFFSSLPGSITISTVTPRDICRFLAYKDKNGKTQVHRNGCQVKVPEILRFPNEDGFLFNHVWGKTLRDGDSNVFGIKRNPQTKICPVQGIEYYMAMAQQLRIDLTRGFLFRPTTPQGGILDAPFSSSAAEARLKGYLKEMGSDDGETLHGFRAELSEIMDHVGWTRRHTALHYLQLAKVLNPAGASARLSTVDFPSIASGWNDVNALKRFVSAFPSPTTEKRSFTEK